MKKIRLYGMTLVEVIIAMAILGIIVVAFLNMFMAGILGIFSAGDKGVAYSQAQDDLDTRIARGESVETDDLVIEFDGKNFTIPGGMVETEQFVKKVKSQMEVFIPLVPTIELIPKINFEGAMKPVTLSIIGKNTDFSGSSTAQFIDKFGNVVAVTPTITVTDATHATVEFDSDFINALSNYALRIITPIGGEPDQVVRAKYSITMPNLVAVSDDSVYVSDNGEYWMKRSAIAPFPSFGALKDVAYGNGHYLAGGASGTFMIYHDMLGWASEPIIGESQINDIEWSNEYKKYYIAGESGTIKSSDTGEAFTTIYQRTDGMPMNGVSTTLTGKIIAVGADGHIVFSTDGVTFMDRSIPGAGHLNKVVAYDDIITEFYVIVGDDGAIYRSSDAVTWSLINSDSTDNINSIKYRPYNPENPLIPASIVAVGDNGLILTSGSYGASFSKTVYNSGLTDLYDAAFLVGTNHVFVVGDEKIIKSNDLSSWTLVGDFTGQNFKSVTGK